jgi:hypothetical protein
MSGHLMTIGVAVVSPVSREFTSTSPHNRYLIYANKGGQSRSAAAIRLTRPSSIPDT